MIGIFIIAVLYVKKVKGAILIGIFATWILGIICQLTGLYVVTPDAGYYSLIPAWSSFNLGAISSVFGQCFKADFSSLRAFDFVAIVCAFLFVDIFDTLGTLIGCATKADMLDKEGKLPRIKEALLADAIATTAGAVLGTSGRRRKNRPFFCCNRTFVPACCFPFSDFYYHSELCNSSGIIVCRFPDDLFCYSN